MMKLLAYTNGNAASRQALHFAAVLRKRIKSHLAVITVRSGTYEVEEPPPVGEPIAFDKIDALPRGLQILTQAAQYLAREGLFEIPESITLRDMPQGHMFVCRTPDGQGVLFYECFGHFIDTLNKEVDRHGYNLLIVAPPRRKGFRRLITGDTTRKLTLDLHTSILVVRGGDPDSRYLICADGSPSSRRQFPILQHLLPAIRQPVDLLSIRKPDMDEKTVESAQDCLAQAERWLDNCGKKGVVQFKEGESRLTLILENGGRNSVIMMGASLRHDVHRRMLGSLPMQVLDHTESSVLLAKSPPEADADYMRAPFTCE